MEEKWCCDMLENLKMEDIRNNALREIRGHLSQMYTPEIAITKRLLNAPEIYDCVDESKASYSERLDLASEILCICMSNLSIRRDDFSKLLKHSITHPISKIRSLALKTILKELEAHAGEDVSIDDDLIIQVLKAVQDDDTSVGALAVGILSISLECKLDQNFVKEALLRALKSNAVIKLRILEVAVNLAKRFPETIRKNQYILHDALFEMDKDEVQVQVDIMEILLSLAEQNYGLLFLEQRQFFEALCRRVESLVANAADRKLIPAIIKFFGNIATLYPHKISTWYPHMVSCLLEVLNSEDISILPAAFVALANLVKRREGKFLMEAKYPRELKEVFEKFAVYLRNFPSDLKKKAFETLEAIFSWDHDMTADLSLILRRWFDHLAGGTNMQFLMDVCGNPFPDIRVACLMFIKAICCHHWGVVALKNTEGFIEYLLDRKAEFNSECKYVKCEVLKLLAKNISEFDDQDQLQLQQYVDNGPYFT